MPWTDDLTDDVAEEFADLARLDRRSLGSMRIVLDPNQAWTERYRTDPWFRSREQARQRVVKRALRHRPAAAWACGGCGAVDFDPPSETRRGRLPNVCERCKRAGVSGVKRQALPERVCRRRRRKA